MTLRNQPYIPLYVQDFLTDEKLNECSAEATGVYIKVMCIMHKSNPYGKILLKQKDKQNSSKVKNFASKLLRHLPYSLLIIERSLNELISEDVLQLNGNSLCQKRMIKDCEISTKRAKAGKKGGKKTQEFASSFAKANIKANSEYEYESEYINKELFFNVPIPKSLNTKECVNAAVQYFQYKADSHKAMQSIPQVELFFKKLNKFSGGDPEKAIKIIEYSIGGTYPDIYELKEKTEEKKISITEEWDKMVTM